MVKKTYWSGPVRRLIAQESNGWGGSNNSRWQNAEDDAAFEAARTEMDLEAQIDLFIQMNDLVVNDVVLVPLVTIAGGSVASYRLRFKNIIGAPIGVGLYWKIANWNTSEYGTRLAAGLPVPRA